MNRQSFKVLLVEDVPLLAKITEQMLRKSPWNRYTVNHSATLADARAAIELEDFDVVLLDLNLPDSSELPTLEALLGIAPDLPVIVMTASQAHEVGHKAIKMGAQDFLAKGDFNFLALDRAIVYSIERHGLQRTIRQLAVVDELTGLYNRRGFTTLHPDIFQQVRQAGTRGYLCFFDLDRFKHINDELGHKAGDEALVEFSANLRSIFRKDSLLVRLGGDEFVAMGEVREPGQVEDALQALEIVLSVRNGMGTSRFPLEASHGVAYFDRDGPATLAELTAAADAELYRNKEARKRARVSAGLQLQEERA
jgi:diguanylate cyclase (GGDEF)-like protein